MSLTITHKKNNTTYKIIQKQKKNT